MTEHEPKPDLKDSGASFVQGELLSAQDAGAPRADPPEAFPGEAEVAEAEIIERREQGAMASGEQVGVRRELVVAAASPMAETDDPAAIVASPARHEETGTTMSPETDALLVGLRHDGDRAAETAAYNDRLAAGQREDAARAVVQGPVNEAGAAAVKEALRDPDGAATRAAVVDGAREELAAVVRADPDRAEGGPAPAGWAALARQPKAEQAARPAVPEPREGDDWQGRRGTIEAAAREARLRAQAASRDPRSLPPVPARPGYPGAMDATGAQGAAAELAADPTPATARRIVREGGAPAPDAYFPPPDRAPQGPEPPGWEPSTQDEPGPIKE